MVHFSLFKFGSTLLYHLSLHCLPILPGRKVAISFHFLRPYSATFFLRIMSSSGVQLPLIYLTVPSSVLFLKRSHLSIHSISDFFWQKMAYCSGDMLTLRLSIKVLSFSCTALMFSTLLEVTSLTRYSSYQQSLSLNKLYLPILWSTSPPFWLLPRWASEDPVFCSGTSQGFQTRGRTFFRVMVTWALSPWIYSNSLEIQQLQRSSVATKVCLLSLIGEVRLGFATSMECVPWQLTRCSLMGWHFTPCYCLDQGLSPN